MIKYVATIIVFLVFNSYGQIQLESYDADTLGNSTNSRPVQIKKYPIGKIKLIVNQKKMTISIKDKYGELPWDVIWYQIIKVDHNEKEIIYHVLNSTGTESILIISKNKDFFKLPTSHGWCLSYTGSGLIVKFKGR
jgi:hypothetical protein